MKTPKIFRRMVAMAVTLAIALSLCAPVLAEMPPLPDLSSGIALLSQTNSAEECTFDIGKGSLKIDQRDADITYVWVGEELIPHIVELGQKIVITGSTTDNRIVIDGDPSRTAELVLDNVKINSTDKSDYRNTHYTIRVLNGSLDLTLRGENVFQNVHIAIGMEGEGKDLTVQGDGTLDINARDTSIQVNGNANFFLGSTGRVTNLNSNGMGCTTEIKGKVTLTDGNLKVDELKAGHGGLEMTDGVLEFSVAKINGDMKVTGGIVNVKKDSSDHYAWAADVADNVIIGDAATNNPVNFTIQGDWRCMTMHRDLLVQGNNTYVHIYGGGADAISASGMVISGGVLDVSGIHCTGGSGKISGNTCIKTFSLINDGKKVEVGENARIYLMSSDRTGYLRTDFRGGTGWVVFDGDGDDMHVIPTYYNIPQQSEVQDPATYKNLNLNPGDVPEYYKIGDGPIEVVVCENGSQLVYQSNNEAGYVDAGSSVRITSSGKSTGNTIKITRRGNSTARASVILDNVNLNVWEQECALTVECPADITVERSSKLSRLWYGNRAVIIRNAEVTFKTDSNNTLTIEACDGMYCENSIVTFENANVDIKGWNERPAISGQNSKIIFADGSKAKLRMLGNDGGVTATVRGSAMVYLNEQWEQGTAVTTEDLTSGWLLYGDKEDLRGMPTGCSLPDGVDLDQPVTYQSLNATTSFDVAESPVAVTVARDGQRTVNWNGQNYSIWNAKDPVHITCTGQAQYCITVNNASNEATGILLDNVNINSTYAVALSTMGSTKVILQGDNTLQGQNYGIYSQLGSTTNGNVTIESESGSNATLNISGDWDGIRIGNGTLTVEGVAVNITGEIGHGIEANGNVTLKDTKVTVTGARASIIGNIVSITGNSVVNAVTNTDIGDGIVGNMTVSISGSAKVKAKKITSGTVTVGGTSMVYLTDQPDAEEEIGTYFDAQDGTGWLVYKMDGAKYSVPAGYDLSGLNDDTDPASYEPLKNPQSGNTITVTHGVANPAKAEKDTLVKVTAVAPKDGKSYEFKGWTVDEPEGLTPETGTLNESTFTFKMPDNEVKLTAKWEEKDAPGPSPDPKKQHSITVWYGATDCLTAAEGETVTAQTMAPVGGGKYTFKGWTVDEPDKLTLEPGSSLNDLTFKFTMPDCDVELTAEWEENPEPTPDPKPEPTRYTVTVLNGYADRFHVKKDQIVTVTTTWPEDGGDYYFKGWTLEGPAELDITEGSLNDLNFKFRMPETNVKLTAEWEKTPGPTTQYSVTVTNGIADHPQAEKDTAVKVMTVQPKDDGNYEFKGWTVTAPEEGLTITEGSLNDLTFTFTMPASDVALTANWEVKPEPEPDQYTVTVTGGTADHAKAKRNTSVEVTAVQPEDGKKYVFKGWTVNKPDELTIEKGSLEETSFIFRMPEENVELTAVWKEETESDSDSDGSGAVVIALAAGAAVWGGYEAVTRILLSQKLPEGAEIPASRKDLALLIWQTAGSPEPQAEPAFPDLADMTEDAAKAAQWCVEQGLLDLQTDGRFAPDGWVPKFHVIEVWDKAFPEEKE